MAAWCACRRGNTAGSCTAYLATRVSATFRSGGILCTGSVRPACREYFGQRQHRPAVETKTSLRMTLLTKQRARAQYHPASYLPRRWVRQCACLIPAQDRWRCVRGAAKVSCWPAGGARSRQRSRHYLLVALLTPTRRFRVHEPVLAFARC